MRWGTSREHTPPKVDYSGPGRSRRRIHEFTNAPSTDRVMTSLRVGERVLVWCDDGLLHAEYALFDEGDTVLHAADPVTVRETGYMTTAGEAAGRLARVGLTRALAEKAARALSREVMASFARTAAVRDLAGKLGAQELFDGAIYRARAQRYEGMWLDLRAFVDLLPPGSALLLQALHLAVTLTEVPDAAPLHLMTAAATRERRPSERTFQRVSLDAASQIPSLLRKLKPRAVPAEPDPQRSERLRVAWVARVRERMGDAEGRPPLQAHLTRLEEALAGHESTADPLADAELRAIDRELERGEVGAAATKLDRAERARGLTPGIRYLRARFALARGSEPPAQVAEEFAELAEGERSVPGASLGAARAWLAAGDDAQARRFAHRIARGSRIEGLGAHGRARNPLGDACHIAIASPPGGRAGHPSLATFLAPAGTPVSVAWERASACRGAAHAAATARRSAAGGPPTGSAGPVRPGARRNVVAAAGRHRDRAGAERPSVRAPTGSHCHDPAGA